MLEWSLSGHCSVCINHSAQNFKGWPKKKTQIEDRSNFTKIFRTISIRFLNLHGFIYRFWLCPSNGILKINEKNAVCTGTPYRDRRCLGTKRTQVKPNANRGWSIKLVNHIQLQLSRLCPKSSWTPTSQNEDGAPPCWVFQRYAYR